jgi:hypothetical protein
LSIISPFNKAAVISFGAGSNVAAERKLSVGTAPRSLQRKINEDAYKFGYQIFFFSLRHCGYFFKK